jgi:hypothetical protein
VLKLASLTTPFFIHAETGFIAYAPLHPCSNNCCFRTLYNSVYLPPTLFQLVSELFSFCLLLRL